MRIVAFDLSLTETGVAYANGGFPRQTTLVPPKGLKGMERLDWIRRQVLLQAKDADHVLLEGYAFGSARGTSQMHSQGELGGVVRYALWRSLPTRYIDVPPATLKLFATGKGNARKEDVLAAAIRRLGYEGSNHNEADARWLLEIGFHLLDRPTAQLPATHLKALEKLRPIAA